MEAGDRAAARSSLQRERGVGAIQPLQSRPDVPKAEPLADRRRKVGTVVGYPDDEAIAIKARVEIDATGAGLLGNAVADGVLDERLEDQAGDDRLARLLAGIDGHPETIAVPRALDRQVRVEKLQLALERYLLNVRGLEGPSQELGQLRKHQIRRLDVLTHQSGDRVQRVEEEVRVKLHLQRLDLRMRQRGLELRRPQLAIAGVAIAPGHVRDGDNGPIREQCEVDLQEGKWRGPVTQDGTCQDGFD